MKTIIQPANHELKPIEFNEPDTKVGVNNLGLLVVTANGEVLGMFNPQNLVGIYHPEGVSKVQVIDAIVTG